MLSYFGLTTKSFASERIFLKTKSGNLFCKQNKKSIEIVEHGKNL